MSNGFSHSRCGLWQWRQAAEELHALSWMTVSPAYLDRRTALPFHCDVVLRLRPSASFCGQRTLQEQVHTDE
ncbi:unnamed protein product [Microthlaspi erraticum]|uniref:Mediator of RNA polymerase II transcription subunit 13 n=1 Tax=Microthlaspi erraticum TaxID=1685480 RepID=A0A6D2HHZ7_9BRAS|nr:unnamed protein product [Microthlaspi erraticum]